MTPASRSKQAAARARMITPIENPLLEAADALLRSAVEASRQNERLSRLRHKGCREEELLEAAEVSSLSHRQLVERTATYESIAEAGQGTSDAELWHAANGVWHAAKEYARRHHACDDLSTKMNRHSSQQLGELTMEYELAASALLVMRQAITGYRRLRPEAE
jgi:hypothetical protein